MSEQKIKKLNRRKRQKGVKFFNSDKYCAELGWKRCYLSRLLPPLVKSPFLSFFAGTNVLAQPRGRREAKDEKNRQHLSRHREAGERRETGKITIFTPRHPSSLANILLPDQASSNRVSW